MRTYRVMLCWPCVLSIALFAASAARADEDPAPEIQRQIGGVIGGVFKAVDNGVTQVKGRIDFRKWVKENDSVRGVYNLEKEKRGVVGSDIGAGVWGMVAAGGAVVTATGNLLGAIPAIGGALLSLDSIKRSIDAREQARFATASRTFEDPSQKMPLSVLKLHRIDLEHAIGRNERSVINNTDQIAKSQAAIKQAKENNVNYRAELEKVNHTLPHAAPQPEDSVIGRGIPAAAP